MKREHETCIQIDFSLKQDQKYILRTRCSIFKTEQYHSDLYGIGRKKQIQYFFAECLKLIVLQFKYG